MRGKASVPDDVDEKTKLIMEEIARLGMGLETFDGEQTMMTKEKFQKYWKQAREKTSSSISTVHFGHYMAAAKSKKLSKYLSQKVTVTV